MSRGLWYMISARTRRSLTLLWIALFVCSLGMQYVQMAAPAPVLAVHDDGLFEMDGNATNSAAAGDDWEAVFDGTDSAFDTRFITDPVDDANDDTFTGGSTKDDINISSWLWKKAKASQAKNDITNAFAAAYTNGDGDTLAYFGLNKWEADGNNFVGFWFLQQAVGPTGPGTPPGSPFSGTHSVGDILVLAQYTNGGTLADFDVFRWVGSGGNVNGTLQTVASGVPCTGAPVSDLACGATNGTTITAPWPYDGRDGDPGVFPPGTFFEGGINLSALNLDSGCFSTFVAETRSSQSVDATLSDFATGQFSFCVPPDIATQVQNDQGADTSTINKGESVTDHVVVSGDKGVAEGTVDFFVCGPDQSASGCPSGGTQVGNDIPLTGGEADSSSFTPSATGWYCFRAEYDPAPGSKYLADSHTNSTTECFRVIPADVQIVKTPNDGSANAGASISFTMSWTNEGEGKATGVVVSDSLPAGDGLDWSISGSTGTGSTCAIAGAVGSEVLTCTVGSIDGNPNFPDAAPVNGTVTVTSATTAADCGAIDNTGQITSNNDGTDTDPGKITVLCPDIEVTKTPDGGSVDAGDPITWSIKVENLGPGSASGVTLTDDLPAGIDWSESEADCTITGAVGSEVLTCTVGTLAAGASKTYQVTGTTDAADCGVVNNTGVASATNEPSDKLANNTDSGSVDVLCADIQIEKTADDDSVSAGDQIGFDIVVSNAGSGTAKNVVVSDTLPTDAGLSWSIESVSGDGSPSCEIVSGVLSCTSAALASGESFTVHIVSGTTSATCGLVDNTASVTTGNDGQDSDDASVSVLCPDVTVLKSADNSPINAGDTAAFTITVGNAGPGVAKGVTLSDPLPAGISWTEDSADCTITAGTLNCSFGDLAVGEQKVIHVTGQTDAADCGTLPNTATVGATNEATAQQGNNTSSASIVVECPDISVVKSGNGPINAGDTATFTITLSNAGPGDAYGVTLSDQLPSGDWTLGGADSTDCAIDGSNLLTCDFGTVLAGDDRVITVSKASDAADCDAIPNTVTVAATNEPAGTDGNTSQATIVVNCPDLEIVKDGNGPISAGEDAVFTITVTNHGPGVAYDVALEDELPAGIVWELGGPNAGLCSIDTAVDPDLLTCDFGTLQVGASRSITLTGETDAADCGSIPNLATTSASNEDTDNDQYPNTDDATVVVDCPEIVITKTAVDPEITAGDPIGFDIVVTNTGDGSAFNVQVTDDLPDGIDWAEDSDVCSIVPDTGTVGQVMTCDVGTLAAQGTFTVHLSGTTDAADCGVVDNTANLTYTGGSGSDDADVTVNCPDVSVIKSGNGPIVNGQTATFTITVTNHGPGDAYEVTLEDQLPAGDWTLGGDDAADCSISASNLLACDFGTIDAPGAESDSSRTITVSKTATTDDCGIIENEVTVGAANEPATDTDDNTDDATIAVRCPDVDIDKTADDTLVEPNQTVTYTINVSVANGPVTNAVVTDELPVGQTYVAGSAAPFEPTVSGGGSTLTWTFASLPSGDPAATITYDVTIDPAATGDPQENTAEVCVDEDTPCASDVALVTPEFPEIDIVKTAGSAADGAVFSTPAGPVTYTYEVTNTGPLALMNVTVTDDAGTPADTGDDFTATCPKTTLAPEESMTCNATVEVTVDTTNIAVARGVTVEGNPAEADDPADVVILEFGLLIDKANDAPLETLELPDGTLLDLPTADEGDTVTYTLDYDLVADPVTNGVITDVLPVGVTYVDGSATGDAQFTFQGYDDATRTLTWTAAEVSQDGSVSYQVTVDEGAAEISQPLVNVAGIDSDQTDPDSDDSEVYVPTTPAAATGTPQITLPPTDTLDGQQSQGNTGFSLMLILLALAAVVLVIGFVTPVPASVRERARR